MRKILTQCGVCNQKQPEKDRQEKDHESSCDLRLGQNTQSTKDSPSCCSNSCCASCTSTIEKSINDRVRELLEGGDLPREMQSVLGSRLSCLPLNGSGYRLLKHQFQIVSDYLSEDADSQAANRWGAVFHLRLIGARIRAARTSTAQVAASCDKANGRNSGCCVR